MQIQDFEMYVVVDDKALSERFGAQGNETRIDVERGQEFSLRICNDSGFRIIAVPSIDGISVMDGKPASYRSPGYILEPHSSINVAGWRLDNTHVAKFIFGSAQQGYARSIGETEENVGVIGAAIFKERQYTPQELWELVDQSVRACSDQYATNLAGAHECVRAMAPSRLRRWQQAATTVPNERCLALQWLLGVCHLEGLIKDADPHRGFEMLQWCAAYGNGLALLSLGICFEEGRGVKKDCDEALRLYDLAVKRGFHEAIHRKSKLATWKGETPLPPYDGGVQFCLQSPDKRGSANTDDVAVGFGRKVRDEIIYTEFERASETPVAVMTMRYDLKRILDNHAPFACPITAGWRGESE